MAAGAGGRTRQRGGVFPNCVDAAEIQFRFRPTEGTRVVASWNQRGPRDLASPLARNGPTWM